MRITIVGASLIVLAAALVVWLLVSFTGKRQQGSNDSNTAVS
jgi:hypothetical protein